MVGFGLEAEVDSRSGGGESVIVVMDGSRSKGRVDALDWAIKYIVRRKDTLLVLGVLSDLGVRLEFSGQGEMSPGQLEEEIEKKREEYQCTLQPFYRQCKKSEVKLEVKLAAGFDPRNITIEEAHNFNPRWIVLDSHLKKDKVYIYGHVACNVAVMKGKGVATLMPSKGPECEQWRMARREIADVSFTTNEPPVKHQEEDSNALEDMKLPSPPLTPQSPCWYPLSWRTGFPRAFSLSELEVITNGFSNDNILLVKEDNIIYDGIYNEIPVLIKRFSGNDDKARSLLKILYRVRHRNIFNLVGYCCSGDELAKNLSWKARWSVALDIGAGLRYLHEECVDGPVVELSISSTHIVVFHGSPAMLTMHTAKWLKDDGPCNEDSPAKCQNIEEDERLLADVRDYGMFLIELISGKSAKCFQEQGEGQSLTDWALPHLKNGSLSQVMDPRLMDTGDVGVLHMAGAALICLKNDLSHKFSMSEVLSVVRGDQTAITKY